MLTDGWTDRWTDGRFTMMTAHAALWLDELKINRWAWQFWPSPTICEGSLGCQKSVMDLHVRWERCVFSWEVKQWWKLRAARMKQEEA